MSFTLIISSAFAFNFVAAPPRPPQAAVEACASLNDGDACSFEGRRGEVHGTCWRPSDELPLACRPAGGPPKRSSR